MTVIRDVVVRVAIEQAQSELKVPDTTGFADAQNQLTTGFDNLNERVESLGLNFDETLQGVANTTDDLGIAFNDAGFAAAEGLGRAGEGAFTAARGFVFLTASTEENAQAMMEQIAVAQGVFDIFKGGKDLLLGGMEAYRALTPAITAATVAKTTHAGANVAVGTSAAGAVPGVTALTAALGPVGLTVIGITAAVGGLALAWQFFDDASDPVDDLVGSLNEKNEALQRGAELARIDREFQDSVAQIEIQSAQDRIAMAESERDQLKIIRQEREKLAATALSTPQAAAVDTEQLGLALRLKEQAAAIDAENDTAIFGLVQRVGAAEKHAQAEELVVATLEKYSLESDKVLASQKQQLATKARDVNLARQELTIVSKLFDLEQMKTQEKIAQLKAAEDLVAQERNRNKSFEQVVGGLAPEEFRRFELISRQAERVGIGGLNQADAGFLRTNFGQFEEFGGQLDAREQRIGRGRGAIGFASRFGADFRGDGSRLAEAQEALNRQLQTSAREIGADGAGSAEAIREFADEVLESRRQNREAMKSALQSLLQEEERNGLGVADAVKDIKAVKQKINGILRGFDNSQ